MRFMWVNGKKRPLHRLVMEAELGRPLRSDEIVRHRDGNLLNNDPGNLVVVSREEHFQLSMASEVREPWTEEEKDDAVRLYCEGMTIDEVACAIGRSYSATRRLLARYAVLRTPQATRALKALFRPATDVTVLPPPGTPIERYKRGFA
jgi:HNH endonuclease